jgi:pyrroline-5-carboxylate reductase
MRIAFIGGGNMATALIGGMVADGRQPADFVVVEPSLAQREKLGERFPGLALHAQPSATALTGVTLVVLAVKPQQMREACTALQGSIESVRAVLSIAAGTRITDISRWLGGYDRILRAMPNTPALIGAGITGLFAPASVDAVGRDAADMVLAAAGEIVWCDDEAMLDGVTGVSGSGPAYVFYLLEGLEQAARELGFAASDARKLAYTTFEGAVRLAQSSELDPSTLRAQVTSKGGTTERGVAVLEQAAVKDALVRAAKAAAARAREMGDVFGADDAGPKA